jgi:hypothetical protein
MQRVTLVGFLAYFCFALSFSSLCNSSIKLDCSETSGPHDHPVCCCSWPDSQPSGHQRAYKPAAANASTIPRRFRSCFPSLVIVGAQKAGTTALTALLSLHADVIPARQKELYFFGASSKQDTWAGYAQLLLHPKFVDKGVGRRGESNPGLFTIDSTPTYMTLPHVITRIASGLPTTRIIALLRDPAGRAWSEYQMYLRRSATSKLPLPLFNVSIVAEIAALRSCTLTLRPMDTLPSDDSLKLLAYEGAGKRKPEVLRTSTPSAREVLLDGPDGLGASCWPTGGGSGPITIPGQKDYLYKGIYLRQVQRLHAAFGRARVLILHYEELLTRQKRTIKRVLDFLNLKRPSPELPVMTPDALDKR